MPRSSNDVVSYARERSAYTRQERTDPGFHKYYGQISYKYMWNMSRTGYSRRNYLSIKRQRETNRSDITIRARSALFDFDNTLKQVFAISLARLYYVS